MKKPELLAPAGNYEGFLGALHAGADAVYLGGQKFGARAYADNFTQEEVCRAIRYAHMLGRKVYLTVNTLMKQAEMEELYEYLLPFYECGLDAVIVQDFGVIRLVRECFADMQLHISTQMTVTGVHAARQMKQWGASRVVPARELSLQELQEIRQQADIEVETFIHGALCYCYSGQCLFSSVLGGRSGNRGKCAQPCRLPYGKENTYPLSMKDLCAIEILPSLIEAGIDSFKIEGRMKKPEYTAGVTAIYRKYIDRCMAAPDEPFLVTEEDLTCLKQLYMRGALLDGYYSRHNGKEMITLEKPGYTGNSDALLKQITDTHLKEPLRVTAAGKLLLQKGNPAKFSVTAQGQSVTVQGSDVVQAKKQPLEKTCVTKQMSKTGNTPFALQPLSILMEEDVFLPVKALNELRRDAFRLLEERLAQTGYDRKPELPSPVSAVQKETGKPLLYASVTTLQQGLALLAQRGIDGLYLPADCLMEDTDALGGYREHCIAVQKLEQWKAGVKKRKREQPSFISCLALPYILRKRDKGYLQTVKQLLLMQETEGILAGSLEAYAWLKESEIDKPVILDANLYLWNEKAAALLGENKERTFRFTLPLEGDRKQLRSLAAADRELIVYGRSPMMISANCVRKTCGECLLTANKTAEQAGFYELTDRYRKKFPVSTQCRHCYNIIYNSLPTSLHRELRQITEWGLGAVRLQFTTEDAEEAAAIMAWFLAVSEGKAEGKDFPFGQTTRGHFKGGVD